MGLPHPWRAEHDDVRGPLDEGQAGELAHHFTVEAGLEGEVELLERLHPRQARQLEPTLHPVQVSSLPLDLQRFGEKSLVVEFALGRLLAHAVELDLEMGQLELLDQSAQFHRPTSS